MRNLIIEKSKSLFFVLSFILFAQVNQAQTTYYLTTSGGDYSTEKWVSITTGINGTGTQVWGQGNGTYSNGAGLLTDQAIDLTGYEGQTLYLNCYDKYDDSWDGTTYVLEETASGPTIINNGGVSPTDSSDDDLSYSWEGTSSSDHAGELETSEAFTIPSICSEPSTQASGLSFSNIGLDQMDLSWTRGDGDNILIIAQEGSSVSDPTLSTSYTASSTFSSGDAIGSGYVIYNGSGTSMTLTGLNSSTTYHFGLYEYNNTDVCYNIDELTGNETTSSYDSDSKVIDPSSQIAATTISSINNDASNEAMNVFSFKIQDLGTADGTATEITNIRIQPGTSNNADWTNHIQGVKLFYDGTEVPLASSTITDTYIDLTTTEGTFNIADGEIAKEATLQIYLNTSKITDGSILQFMIDADNNGFTAGSNNSSFSSDFGSDVISNNITIDVTASALSFATQPSNTLLNNNMTTVEVEAVDANGNRDLDFNSQIDITSTGTLSSSPQSATASSGIASFSSIAHSAAGTGLTLNAERNGTGDWDITSNTFDIVETPDICSDAQDIYGNSFTAIMSDANNDYADGETDSGAEASFTAGSWNTMFPCNSSSNHSAYYYTDFKDLWFSMEIPDGVDEFTIDVSNFSGSGYAYFLPYYGSCASLTQMTVGSGGVTNNTMPTLSTNGSITYSGAEVITASTSTIYIRAFMHDNSTGVSPNYNTSGCSNISYPTFDIIASAPQPNDVDDDAIEIDATSSSGNLCDAATESEPTETGDACAASQATNDLWYKITAGGSDPTANGKISVTFDNADDAVVVTEFWGAFSNGYTECVTLTSTGAGSTVSHTFSDDINAGNTNYYRVTPLSGNSVCTFTISGARVVPNDDCSEFESVSTSYNLSSSRDANFSYASASGTTLPGGGSDASTTDLYYNFTSNSSTIHGTVMYSGKVDISLSGISAGTYTLAVYKRDPLYSPCGSLTSNLVSYQENISSDGTYTLCSDITEGNYLVRLIKTAGSDETVTISATPSAASPLNSEGDYLANNTSISQTTFDIINNSFTNEDFSLDNDGCEATSLSDNGNHITESGKDLWYTFETDPAPSCDPTVSQDIEGITITYSSSGGTGYVHMELYTSISDAGYVDEASILAGSASVTFTGLDPSTRYYLRVEQHSITNTDQFNISAAWTNPIPCYDTYQTAYDITNDFANGPCPRDGSLTDYSMQGANAEIDGDEDVWFKFTQPDNADEFGFTHIRLSNEAPDYHQMTVELWESVSGVPSSKIETTGTTASITPVYDEVFINTGQLTAGQTYFVRVIVKESVSETENVKFNICIFDDNGGHFNISCPNTTDANIGMSTAVECDGLSGVDGDCNLTYRLNLTPITPSAWYRIEVLANEPIETPQLYNQGANVGAQSYDYDNPCNRQSVGNLVANSGTYSNPNAECSGASDGKWIVANLIGSSSFESNIYNLWIGATAASGCLGLDLCEINFMGPFASQADAEGGVDSDVNGLYCAYFDYGDLDDGADTYPEVYGIYNDENGDGYPDDGVWLGDNIDAENFMTGNEGATGDDNSNTDDEDGLTVITKGTPGGTAELRVVGNAVAAGTTVHVGMWIDWDGNGFQADDFYSGSGVTASPVNIDFTVNVPSSFSAGNEAKVMVKAGLSAFTFGMAADNVINGEIEGHVISFPDVVLPIELIEFKAENSGDINRLSWITGSEENTDYFVVERSLDGVHFESLDSTDAAGWSTDILSYELIDKHPYQQTYYRLKNVDFDGQYSYSKIEVVLIDGSAELSFNVYPNPNIGDELNLMVNSYFEELAIVEIMDITGRVVHRSEIDLKNGFYTGSINISNLSEATYLISITSSHIKETLKLVVEN